MKNNTGDHKVPGISISYLSLVCFHMNCAKPVNVPLHSDYSVPYCLIYARNPSPQTEEFAHEVTKIYRLLFFIRKTIIVLD